MKAKNLMVFFLAMASVLLMASSVSAGSLASFDSIKVNGIKAHSDDVAVVAGDKAYVEVLFTAKENASDVVIESTFQGKKDRVSAETESFTVENGSVYKKVLTLRIPSELEDQVSRDLDLETEIRSGNDEVRNETTVRVQRPSYDADVMSISASGDVEAGNIYPVEVVLKNTGYNELKDMYVTASVSGLDVERELYLGDIVALEDCDDGCEAEDTLRGTFNLEIPQSAEPGEYVLNVEGENRDLEISDSEKVSVKNNLPKNIVVSRSERTVEVGEEASYELTIANPTDSLKVYNVVTESSKDVSTSTDSSVISVPAGSTKKVTVTANPSEEGEHVFEVGILSGEDPVESVELSVNAEDKSVDNSIVALTVVLAVIFVVLLVVLFVLLGKKPNKKTEDFGESYY